MEKQEKKKSLLKNTGAESVLWDLSGLYKGLDDPAIERTLRNGLNQAKAFSLAYKNKLHTLKPEKLKNAYVDLEAVLAPLYKLSQYASLMFSTDVSNHQAKALSAMIDEAESKISNELVFFELELGKMDSKKADVFIKAKSLSNYYYHLEMTRKTAKFHLSEKEEQVINLKDVTGADACKRLYEELTSNFKYEFEIDGQKRVMNGSELRALRHHENADVRQRAMKTFFKKYEENSLVLTHLFNTIVKDYNIERELRGYKSAINIRNVHNDLPDKAVAALHEVTTESNSLVNRYYKLKKKLLNLKKMTLADIYAPMPKSSKTYTWQQTVDIVFQGLAGFDSEILTMAQSLLTENRVHAPVLPAKRGGAFCSSSTPDINPFVMVNFLGKQRDIATLAHELGHGIHDILSSKQTLLNYHPVLPLAETASVFSEMIITDLLLKNETDPVSRIAILTDKLEDIFATSHRQNMFSRFEILTHDKISKDLLSSDHLCGFYKQELEMMFGDSVDYTEEYFWEWSSIPHIYEWPFYVYAYNFGNLLVMGLYEQYLEQGSAFIPAYKELLAKGGSASPADITSVVGIDIMDKRFWKKSLRYIASLIDQLEALTSKT
ncbi:M3 family oligoendopeptidase [Thermoproteota archaeon]